MMVQTLSTTPNHCYHGYLWWWEPCPLCMFISIWGIFISLFFSKCCYYILTLASVTHFCGQIHYIQPRPSTAITAFTDGRDWHIIFNENIQHFCHLPQLSCHIYLCVCETIYLPKMRKRETFIETVKYILVCFFWIVYLSMTKQLDITYIRKLFFKNTILKIAVKRNSALCSLRPV